MKNLSNKAILIALSSIFFFAIISYFLLDQYLSKIIGANYENSLIWLSVTQLGDTIISYFILGLIMVGFFLGRYVFKMKIKPALVLMIIYSYLTSTVIIQLMKRWVPRYRPILLDEGFYGFTFNSNFIENTDSFPSLHTGVIASVLFPILFQYRKASIYILAIITSVALSRVMLNLHYISDVLFSIFLVGSINYILYSFIKKDL